MADAQRNNGSITPCQLLIIFCVINMINYLDRGLIASNGVNGTRGNCTAEAEHIYCDSPSGIQGEFELSNFQDGVLPAAFMVGLLIASPIFAELSKDHNAFRLIGVGLGIWTCAVVGCGLAPGFYFLAICRMFVGVGEASFVSLAAPFIDDYAPANKKSQWLSLFYMCIPAGVALGYVFGGCVTVVFSWRVAFFMEAALMLPAVVFGFVAEPLTLKGGKGKCPASACYDGCEHRNDDDERTEEEGAADHQGLPQPVLVKYDNQSSYHSKAAHSVQGVLSAVRLFLVDLKALLTNRIYMVNIVGYTFYTAVIGAYSFWGPKAGKAVFDMDGADVIFGGLTVLTGIFGTVCGGVVLDMIGNTIPRAFALCMFSTFVGGVLCILSFFMKTQFSFIILLGIGELFLFAIQGPVNIISLACVPPRDRALSIAMGTVIIHVFGDVPSPPILGMVQDHLLNWRISMGGMSCILLLASIAWGIGWVFPEGQYYSELACHDVHSKGPMSARSTGVESSESQLLLSSERGV